MENEWYLIIKWMGCGHEDQAKGWYIIEPGYNECPFCGEKSVFGIMSINDPTDKVPDVNSFGDA